MREGDIVTMLAPPRADGLVEVLAGNRRGNVPFSFLEEPGPGGALPRTRLLNNLVDSRARRGPGGLSGAGGPSTGRPERAPYVPGAGKRMRARMDYEPTSSGANAAVPPHAQLPFRKGDLLYVNYSQAATRSDGFVMAMAEEGDAGLVPFDFLEEANDLPLSQSATSLMNEM